MLAAVLGWLGTIGTFVAYFLVFRGHLFANSLRYGLLNTVGGTLGGTAAALYSAWPSAVSNFVWAGVGIVTVITATKDRLRPQLACYAPRLMSRCTARLGTGEPSEV